MITILEFQSFCFVRVNFVNLVSFKIAKTPRLFTLLKEMLTNVEKTLHSASKQQISCCHQSLLFDQGFPNNARLQHQLADQNTIWRYLVSIRLYLTMLFILSLRSIKGNLERQLNIRSPFCDFF